MTQPSVPQKWAHVVVGPELKPLSQACGDCAVTTGFYQEYADELAKEPKDVQCVVASHWFCHNAPDRACGGLAKFLEET